MVIIIDVPSPVVDFMVVIIKGDNPVVDFVVVIEVDTQLGADAEAEVVVSLVEANQIEVNHIGVVVAVEVVVNLVVVLIQVGVIIGKIHIVMVKGNILMRINVVGKLQIKLFHIINLQIATIVEFGDMLIRNVNGSMMIFLGWLKNIVKWDSEI